MPADTAAHTVPDPANTEDETVPAFCPAPVSVLVLVLVSDPVCQVVPVLPVSPAHRVPRRVVLDLLAPPGHPVSRDLPDLLVRLDDWWTL